MAELVRNVRSAQAPARPEIRLEEDTVVAVLNTIHEIVSDSLDNARSLLQARGVPALVALGASRWVGARRGGAGPAAGRGTLTRARPGLAAANRCARRRPRPTCCRPCGVTGSCAGPCRRKAGPRRVSRYGLCSPLLAFPRPRGQAGSFAGAALTAPSVFNPNPSRLLLLPRGPREHRVPEALTTAPCHWWTKALVSTGQRVWGPVLEGLRRLFHTGSPRTGEGWRREAGLLPGGAPGWGPFSGLAASQTLSTPGVHTGIELEVVVPSRTVQRRNRISGVAEASRTLACLPHCCSKPAARSCLADGENPGSQDVIPMEALGPGECGQGRGGRWAMGFCCLLL